MGWSHWLGYEPMGENKVIRTQDLVSFMCREQSKGYAYTGVGQEYIEEIIKRLRELDKLKKLPKNRGK